MDCPVCKCPNPAGATHCNMCYEVFNRSAAQTYLQLIRRKRRKSESADPEPEAVIKSQRVVAETRNFLSEIDWGGIARQGVLVARQYWRWAAAGAGLIVTWMFISFLFSASLWYHLLGKKLLYAYPEKETTQYLVGMKQHIKIWSERQGRLDTPMEDVKSDEMGNVMFASTAGKVTRTVHLHVREWIQVLTDAAGSTSHTIAKDHPSLAGARLLLSKKGNILERHYVLAPRLGKSIPFLTPRFPKGSVRHGKTWDEDIEWLDAYDDWLINWSGTLHWTAGELEDCGTDTCVKLTYTADLKPRLRKSPEWAGQAATSAQGEASSEGQVLFDASHRRLVGNLFSYDGLLRIPISKLERIPWELRVGRRVKGPGEIMIRFENKIDVRKN